MNMVGAVASIVGARYAQRSKTLNERKKQPQRVLALDKEPQREMSSCGCFKTTTTRCDIREKAATRKFVLWLFLKDHNALWHVKICHDAKRLSTSLKYRKVSLSFPIYRHDAM
jgi:hypothetical protein